jgi:drug/metabolite transporter (DMT)-like permease
MELTTPSQRRPASALVAAGVLILAVTALFAAVGVERGLAALDPDRIDRDTLLAGIDFGLNPEAVQNLSGIAAALLLLLCLLTTILGVGVLLRRESVRLATIGTFAVFAAVMVPLALAGVLSGEPSTSTWVGLGAGVVDAIVVYLLAKPETKREFELAERARQARRAERSARRRAARTGAPAGS